MGLFDRFKRGLAKTRDKIAGGFRAILPFGKKIDEQVLDAPQIQPRIVGLAHGFQVSLDRLQTIDFRILSCIAGALCQEAHEHGRDPDQ